MKEILKENIQELMLEIFSNKIRGINTKKMTKTACRVYENGNIGISGRVGEVDLNELYEKARRNLEFQIDYPVEPTKNIEFHTKIDSCKITNTELYEELEKILKELDRLHPDFAVNNKVKLNQYEFSMENELGMNLSYFDRYITLLLNIKPKSSSDDSNTFFYFRDRKLEPEKIIKASSELISAYSNILPMPKEPLPIILEENENILTKIFGDHLSAYDMGTGSSLFQNQLGKEVFAKDFSLKIKHDSMEMYGQEFDMEGVITPEELSYLIKDGVIIRPYSDKLTSKQYGYENTGCAGGYYDSVPRIMSPYLEIQSGKKSLKELLNGQNGILVMLAAGCNYSFDGNYASPVQLSYLTDGEKLLGRLPEFVMKGSVYDIFGKNFIGKSNDRLYTNNNNKMLVTKMNIETL